MRPGLSLGDTEKQCGRLIIRFPTAPVWAPTGKVINIIVVIITVLYRCDFQIRADSLADPVTPAASCLFKTRGQRKFGISY